MAVNRFPRKDEKKKQRKSKVTFQGYNHGDVQDGGTDSVNHNGGCYLFAKTLFSRVNFLWFLLDVLLGSKGPASETCVATLFDQQRAPFDNCTSWLQLTDSCGQCHDIQSLLDCKGYILYIFVTQTNNNK